MSGRGDSGTRETMARWGAIYFALGGLFGLVSLVLPDTRVDDRTLLLAVTIALLSGALTLGVVYDRMPLPGFQIAAAGGMFVLGCATAWPRWSPASPTPPTATPSPSC